MNVLGIFIRCSKLKIAYGDSNGEMKTALRNSGAIPADRFGTRFDGKSQDDFLRVLVDGEPFIAGVSSDRAEMWERSLHADYARTKSCTALMHAGLLMSGISDIDVLITDPPVSQFNDSVFRKELESKFVGHHQISPKRTVNVKTFQVIAQPVGGLLDYIDQQPESDDHIIDDDVRVLVIDPGFFSFD